MNKSLIGTAAIAILAFALGSAPRLSPPSTGPGGSAWAQLRGGIYRIRNPETNAVAGWVFSSTDRTREYWAYIEGTYTWATSDNTSSNPWTLKAEYIGAPSYSTFVEFRDAVLAESAAQGKTITFQNHTVFETVTDNE